MLAADLTGFDLATVGLTGDDDLTVSDGFSKAEREAMKQRAAELRAERGGRKKADNLRAAIVKLDRRRGGAGRGSSCARRFADHDRPRPTGGVR